MAPNRWSSISNGALAVTIAFGRVLLRMKATPDLYDKEWFTMAYSTRKLACTARTRFA